VIQWEKKQTPMRTNLQLSLFKKLESLIFFLHQRKLRNVATNKRKKPIVNGLAAVYLIAKGTNEKIKIAKNVS